MNSVIIPAAGKSSRMGDKIDKQLVRLNSKELIIHTLEIFERNEKIDEIILVVNSKKIKIFKQLIRNYNLDKIKIISGGDSRKQSVYLGLLSMDKSKGKVLIHDGARPFLKDEYIDKILNSLNEYEGCVLGVDPKNTIKNVKDGFIKKTYKRDNLCSVQTPQGFRKNIILKAYEKGIKEKSKVTDDSSLVEKLGIKVKIIKGDYTNFKITTKIDLELAKVLIRKELI
ncbi:MAG: 2-C-methyl-D-erythritol 4-phosphate cytidylyltransferase [Bacillota bacterium]